MVKAKYSRNQNDEANASTTNDTLKNMLNMSRAKQYAWAISHLYPDIYQPQRYPDQYRFPTHIMTNRFQRTLTVPATKDFAIYFCPLADCFYNYKFHAEGEVYEGLNTPWETSAGVSDAYISYADNDSKSTNVADSNSKRVFVASSNEKFNNALNWNYSTQGSVSLKKFKKIRLIGAAIKITYTGKLEDLSGIVKTSMGVKGFTTPLSAEDINTEELHNFPEYKSFTLDEPIICRYRMTHDDFTEFGPYTPYSSLPFYMIYGKGLQEGSSVFIEIIKHFEGVVIPEEEEFVSPVRAPNNQLPLSTQLDFVSQYKADGLMDTIDEESHKDLKAILD